MARLRYYPTPADFGMGFGEEVPLLNEAETPIGSLVGRVAVVPSASVSFEVCTSDDYGDVTTDLLDGEGVSIDVWETSDSFATLGRGPVLQGPDDHVGPLFLTSDEGATFYRIEPDSTELYGRVDDLEGLEATRSIKALADVADTNPTNGQVLRFNNGTGLYEPVSGIGASALDDLSDVDSGAATTGQALVRQSNGRWAGGTVAGGVTAHSALTGLSGDDHTQYLNATRGDARYYTKAQTDTLATAASTAQSANDRARANHTGTQPISSVDGLSAELASKALPGQTAGTAGGKFYGLYADFASLPAAGSGQLVGDFALYIVE